MAECNDVLSLQDLQNAKAHNTFEAEVITGKAGGVAGGATIETATNSVTAQVQKTLPKILDDLNWDLVGKFVDGVTFTKSTDFALDGSNVQWIYVGSDPFPKTVAPAFVPTNPDYQVIHTGSLQALSGLTLASELDSVHTRTFANVAAMIAFGDHVVGHTVKVASTGVEYLIASAQTVDEVFDFTVSGGLVALNKSKSDNRDYITAEQRTNYTMTPNRMIFGEEYLWSLINRILLTSNSVPINFVWSGDSTTAGVNAGSNTVTALADLYSAYFGLGEGNHINAGHSGQSAVLWNTFYLPNHIASYSNMDAYIVRWGINDGSEHGSVSTFIANMDAGLAQLRAFKGIDDLAIVVMSPNATYDPVNNRSTEWLEQAIPELRKICRKYMCTFFDTYSMFQDAKQGAIVGDGRWLDDSDGAGHGIHPDGAFNHIIMRKVMEMMLSPLQRIGLAKNSFVNNESSFAPTAATQPASYASGIAFYSVSSANGWPYSGKLKVETFGRKVIQTLYPSAADAVQDNPFVSRISRIGDKSLTWAAWRGLPIDITPLLINGWTATGAGAWYVHHESGTVQLIGEITGGSSNTDAFILPVQTRPSQVRRFATVNASLAFASIQVKTTGAVSPAATHAFLDVMQWFAGK